MTHPFNVVPRRAAILLVSVVVLAPAFAARAATWAAPAPDAMGPRSTVSLPAFTGTFDTHKVLYLVLDTSSKGEARRDHLDYSPSLARALPSTNALYLVMNGAFTARGPIFAYRPGEAGYTPLVREVLVRWTTPGAAVALESDEQIKRLAHAGTLKLTMTGTVVNSPIIKVLSGETAGETSHE